MPLFSKEQSEMIKFLNLGIAPQGGTLSFPIVLC
jgi:hypothetical protein